MSVQADAGLEDELDVEADVDGVEAAVELDGVDADVGPGDAGILDPYLGGVLDDILSQIGQEDADVLEAVAVTAGVQNAVGLHADGAGIAALAASVPKSAAGAETVVRHDVIPPYGFGRRDLRTPPLTGSICPCESF